MDESRPAREWETNSSDFDFAYPTSRGIIRSVQEFRESFLPEYLTEVSLGTRARRTLHLARTLPESPLDVLDYGCGAGVFAYHLARSRRSWTVSGWDGDRSSIEIAASCFSAPNLSFEHRGYSAYQTLQSNSLDLISFLEVLEHVDRPGDILATFRSALRPGGHLLLSTPYAFGFNAITAEARRRINVLIRRRGNDAYTQLMRDTPYDSTTHLGHVAIYTLPALSALLHLHGFTVTQFDIIPLTQRIRHRVLPETAAVLAKRS